MLLHMQELGVVTPLLYCNSSKIFGHLECLASVSLFALQATGREAMMASFYHGGYEDPLLMLIRRRGVDAGLVIKVCLSLLSS